MYEVAVFGTLVLVLVSAVDYVRRAAPSTILVIYLIARIKGKMRKASELANA